MEGAKVMQGIYTHLLSRAGIGQKLWNLHHKYESVGQQSPDLQGASEMGAMEHLLNVYASKAAKHSVANYVGYAQVMPHEANRSLTQGLWLVSCPYVPPPLPFPPYIHTQRPTLSLRG